MVTRPADLQYQVLTMCILQLLVGLIVQVYHEPGVWITYGLLVNLELHQWLIYYNIKVISLETWNDSQKAFSTAQAQDTQIFYLIN